MDQAPSYILYVLIFASAFLAMQVLIGLGRQGARKLKAANLRAVLLAKHDTQAQAFQALQKSRGLEQGGMKFKAMQWLANLVTRSGLPIGTYGIYLIMSASAFFGGVAGFLLTQNFIVFVLGFAGGFILPVLVVKFIVKLRIKKALRQLPEALDVIVRSLRAGHPVPVAIDLVAREMPDPIGSEFGMASDEITYGTTLGKAVQRMADRIGHVDYDIFAATVRLQEKTGGNLTELLSNISRMTRERQKMRLKIKAASSEGRMSAMILNVVPILLFAAVNFLSPSFYGEVKDVPMVTWGLVAAGGWLLIGNLVIRKMINFRI